MNIKVQIPRILQPHCGDEQEFVVNAGTVAELLNVLRSEYPGLYESICDETGRLRQHVNLFLNNDLCDRSQLKTRLKSNDVVSVFQAVSGG